jgi:uncharacterized protein YndB with AHSA1/START domain
MIGHTPNPSQTLSLKRTFDAAPEKVFAAWTNPELLKQWWGPPGSEVTKVEMDLRVDGRYRIGIRHQGQAEFFVSCAFKIIQPPHKLAFTWRWERPDMDIGNSLVTIELQARANQTELLLTHAQLPTPEARAAHREGWVGILTKLGDFLVSS